MKILIVVTLMAMGLAGSFMQYCLLSVDAAQRKWEFCTRFEGDWYCYISNVPYGESDELKDKIHKEYKSYMIKSLNAGVDYSAYQYSEDAWKLFGYPIKEGTGFSKERVNEVIVSKGMSSQYPVGAMMEVGLYASPGKRVETLECEVVGVLEREEIVFPNRFLTANYTFWNENDSFSQLTLQKMFLIINPQLELNHKNTYNESPGVFFDKGSSSDLELLQKLSENGDLVSVQKMYEQSKSKRELSQSECGIIFLFWTVALMCLLTWNFAVIKGCKEDIFYALYIGFSKKKVLRWVCQMNAMLVLSAYILSFAGFCLPTELEVYWKMNLKAPFIAMMAYFFVWLISSGIIFLKYRNYECKTERRVPCIQELTLLDNIQLYLIANEVSQKSAKEIAHVMLQEREIAFCEKRKMENLNVEQLSVFERIIANRSEFEKY